LLALLSSFSAACSLSCSHKHQTPTRRSVGLLPLFNEQSGYLKDKISSSVLASLATSTPLVVPRAFLDTYSYIKPEHVLLMVRLSRVRVPLVWLVASVWCLLGGSAWNYL